MLSIACTSITIMGILKAKILSIKNFPAQAEVLAKPATGNKAAVDYKPAMAAMNTYRFAYKSGEVFGASKIAYISLREDDTILTVGQEIEFSSEKYKLVQKRAANNEIFHHYINFLTIEFGRCTGKG